MTSALHTDEDTPAVLRAARLIQELARIVAAQNDRIGALERRLDSGAERRDTDDAPPRSDTHKLTNRQP